MTVRPRDRLGLLVLLALALAGAYYLLVLKPEQQKGADLSAAVTTQQQQLSQAQQDIAAGRAARGALRANASDWTSIGLAVPNRSDIPALLRRLERTATDERVKMQAIQITPASSSPTQAGGPAPAGRTSAAGGAIATGIQLTVAGGYLAPDRFIHRLDGFVVVSASHVHARGRLVIISGVQIIGSSNPVAHVIATIYQLPPSAPASSGSLR
jgi:hypothetical protein